jgi:hypothetical protein
LAELFKNNYIKNPKLFYCPAATKDDKNATTLYTYHPSAWTNPYSFGGNLSNTYMYYIRNGWGESSGANQWTYQRFTKLKNKAYLCDAFYTSVLWNHSSNPASIDSMNVIYGDGHGQTVIVRGSLDGIFGAMNEFATDAFYDYLDKQ